MKSKRRRDMYLRALQQIARSRFLTENRFRCWVCRTPLIPARRCSSTRPASSSTSVAVSVARLRCARLGTT